MLSEFVLVKFAFCSHELSLKDFLEYTLFPVIKIIPISELFFYFFTEEEVKLKSNVAPVSSLVHTSSCPEM